MLDDKGVSNIIHYGSARGHRVTRSVMTSEIHALIIGFYHAFKMQDLIEEILQQKVAVKAYVDSKTVFDVIAKDGKTTESRIKIDIYALWESYECGELNKLGWIRGGMRSADTFTKQLVSPKKPFGT